MIPANPLQRKKMLSEQISFSGGIIDNGFFLRECRKSETDQAKQIGVNYFSQHFFILTEKSSEPISAFVFVNYLREFARVEPHARTALANVNRDIFVIAFEKFPVAFRAIHFGRMGVSLIHFRFHLFDKLALHTMKIFVFQSSPAVVHFNWHKKFLSLKFYFENSKQRAVLTNYKICLP